MAKLDIEAAARELVERSTVAQGLPVKIEDGAVLRQVAAVYRLVRSQIETPLSHMERGAT